MSSVLLSSLVEVALLLYIARQVLDELSYEPPHRRHAIQLTTMIAAAVAMALGWFANAWLLPVWPHWLTLNPLTLEPIKEAPAPALQLLADAAVWAYGAGVLCLFARWLSTLATVCRDTVRAQPLNHGDWAVRLSALDSDARILLRVADGLNSPVTWGLSHPVILLPARARHWSHHHRDWTLRHELAHIHRHDWLSQQLAHIGCILCWPLPSIWRMNAELRLDAERAADDAVVLAGARATAYGQWLLHEAKLTQTPATVAIHNSSGLSGRLHHLLNRYSVRSRARGHALLSLLVGVLMAQPLVHVQLTQLTIEPVILQSPTSPPPEKPAKQPKPLPTLKLVRELTPLTASRPIARPSRPPDALHQPIPPPRALLRFD